MATYVVDASVALKWILPEVDSPQARWFLDRFEKGLDTLIAPDLFLSEVSNALKQRVRRNEITEQEAREAFDAIHDLNLTLLPVSAVARSALGISLQSCETFYDAAYAALAIDRDCILITADEEFHRNTSGLAGRVRLLSELYTNLQSQ